MADFNLALPTIWLHEGFYSDDEKDPGGATQYGISLRFLMTTGDLDKDGWPDGDINHDGKINVEDIKKMSKLGASKLYFLYFWMPLACTQIRDQGIATKLFDLGINMGTRTATKLIQRAINAIHKDKVLLEDGLMGCMTLASINERKPDLLMPAFKIQAADYYKSLVMKKPALDKFLHGWLKRAYSDQI